MGEISEISWTHSTFNPWWGCTFVGGSPACAPAEGEKGAVCYAKTWDKRTGGDHWGADAPRRFFGDKHWAEPLKWNRSAEKAGERRRVFIMSMGDWAEGRPDQREHLSRLWTLCDETPTLDKLMLTKRPQLINSLMPERLRPRDDMWIGVTAENQYWLDIRWPLLKRVEASIYWLSIEPICGPIILPDDFLALGGRAWVIVGGQSGNNTIPMDPAWARALRDQCIAAGVPFHFKQWGEHDSRLIQVGKKAAGRLLDGRTWDEFPA